MGKKQLINIIFSILIILLIGVFSGYTAGNLHAREKAFPQIREVDEINPGTVTIKFLEVKGGLLKGQISGKEARIAYSPDHIYELNEDEIFEIPLYNINLGNYYAAANIPEGMQYIASSSGKYYYHVLDPKAFKITPKNRRYYSNEAKAEAAGYKAKK